jgi:outer membrane protein assembly factor BamB
VDFGSTPVLIRAPGCPPELAVENKSGALLVYRQGGIAAGPAQRSQVGANASRHGLGIFIGLPAYSPPERMLFVSNPGPDAPPFAHGVVAFRVGTDCALSLAWQRTVGPDGTTTVPSPTVANGVVYAADGSGGHVYALGAADGRLLWDSGRALGGAVFAPPVVVDGRLFVAAWRGGSGGDLYAFGV